MATEGKRPYRRKAPAPQVDWEQKFKDVVEEAEALDRRRRVQLDNQKEVINRVLVNHNWTWDKEQIILMDELTEAKARLEAVADYVTGMKYSSVAREVSKLIGDDA